jgi:acid phosphatase type 7
VGAWHVIALDSYCFERSSCNATYWTSWLKADLAAHPARCTLAYWHEPYWTSPSEHAPDTALRPWVQALYDAGADVVLQAHNHGYERFLPQDPSGGRDDARGIAAFTAGTGGRSHYPYTGTAANSVVKNDDTFGVLKLSLHASSYDWQFLPEPGKTFADSGSAACH